MEKNVLGIAIPALAIGGLAVWALRKDQLSFVSYPEGAGYLASESTKQALSIADWNSAQVLWTMLGKSGIPVFTIGTEETFKAQYTVVGMLRIT